ncbi:MAG: hypothetical protein J5698_03200 [Bacteroidaceae bacterium]|nr:hypothetical protein [Bacteroidaceae bacterium]MBO4589963.1 hypothetical protein [Bacteroidaceae bacterium]MBR5963850.1 hypothetical protein [Bacteroidaceae bacterium]
MSLFKQREPRRFEHNYIYYDERKEKLRNIEEKAKRELGMLEQETYDPEKQIRGKFVEQTKHLKRWKEEGVGGKKRLSPFGAFLIIVVLLLIWRFLLS